jgi:hypothetical protein
MLGRHARNMQVAANRAEMGLVDLAVALAAAGAARVADDKVVCFLTISQELDSERVAPLREWKRLVAQNTPGLDLAKADGRDVWSGDITICGHVGTSFAPKGADRGRLMANRNAGLRGPATVQSIIYLLPIPRHNRSVGLREPDSPLDLL